MGRYLTAQGFAHTPPLLLGDVIQVASDGTPHTLAIAVGFIRNQGDAWSWTLRSAEDTRSTRSLLRKLPRSLISRLESRNGGDRTPSRRNACDPRAGNSGSGVCAGVCRRGAITAQWAEQAEQRLVGAFAAWMRRPKDEAAARDLARCSGARDALAASCARLRRPAKARR